MTDDATINALVAEHVLGWRRAPRNDSGRHKDVVVWWPVPGKRWQGNVCDACNDGNVMLDGFDTGELPIVERPDDGYALFSSGSGNQWPDGFGDGSNLSVSVEIKSTTSGNLRVY